MSLDYNVTTDKTRIPVIPQICVEDYPDRSAGVVIFDILIANGDRNDGNLHIPRRRPKSLFVYDHGLALFGGQEKQGKARLKAKRDDFGIMKSERSAGTGHCLMHVIPSADLFKPWLKRVEDLKDWFIDEVCDAAVGTGITRGEAKEAKSFLKHRRDTMRDILARNQKQFSAISDWGLLP